MGEKCFAETYSDSEKLGIASERVYEQKKTVTKY